MIFVCVHSVQPDYNSKYLIQKYSLWLTCWHQKTKSQTETLCNFGHFYLLMNIENKQFYDWHFENRYFCQPSDTIEQKKFIIIIFAVNERNKITNL